MTTERCNKVMATVFFVLLGLASSPLSADQDLDPATPLVTTFKLGTLLNYDRAAQHYLLYLGRGEIPRDPDWNHSYVSFSVE